MKSARGNTRNQGHGLSGTRAPRAALVLGLGLLTVACTKTRDAADAGDVGGRAGVPMRVTLPRVDPAEAARAARSFSLQGSAMTYHPWHVALRVTGPNGYSQALVVKPGQSEVTLEVPVGTVKIEGVVLGMPLPVGRTLAEMCSSKRLALQTVTDASRVSTSTSTSDGTTGSGGDGGEDGGDDGVYLSTVSTSTNVTATTSELPVSFAPLKFAPSVAFGLRLIDGTAPAPGAMVRFVDAFAQRPILDPCTGEAFTAVADAKGRVANSFPHADGVRNAIALALPRGQVATLPLVSSNASANFFDVNVATGSIAPMSTAMDFFGLGSTLADLAARRVDLGALLRRAENLQRNKTALEGNLWLPGMTLPAPKAVLRAPSSGVVGPFSLLECWQETVRTGSGTNINQRVEWKLRGEVVGMPSGGGAFYVPRDAKAGDEISCRVQLGQGDGSNTWDNTKWSDFGQPASLRLTTSDPQPVVAPEFLRRQDPTAASVTPIQGGGLRVGFTPSAEAATWGANYKVVWSAGGTIPATCEGTGIQRYRKANDVKAIDIPGASLGNALGASFGVRICAANYIESIGREFVTPGAGAVGTTATTTAAGEAPLPDTETKGEMPQVPGVSSFDAIAIGGNSVRLQWDAPSTVAKFRVEMMGPGSANWMPVGETADKNYLKDGLLPGNRYSFRVVSLDAQRNILSTSGMAGLMAPWFTPFATRGEWMSGLPAGGATNDAAIWTPSGSFGEALIAVALDNGVAISRNKGNSWVLADTGNGMQDSRTKRISIGIQTDAERRFSWPVLCATHENAISLSSDSGSSWWSRQLVELSDSKVPPTVLSSSVKAKACAVFENRTFVATSQGLIILEQGSNTTTTHILSDLGDVNDIEVRADGTLVTAGTTGVHVSDTKGDTWTNVSAPSETYLRASRSGNTVAAIGTSLYVGTVQSGVASQAIAGCQVKDVTLTPQGALHVACSEGLATAAKPTDLPIVRAGADGLPSAPNLGSVASWGEAVALGGGSGVLWRVDTATFNGSSNAAPLSGLGRSPRSLVEWKGTNYVATNEGVSWWNAVTKKWVQLGASGLPNVAIKKLVATSGALYVVTSSGAASLSSPDAASWSPFTIQTKPVADLAWNGSTLGAWVPEDDSKFYVLNTLSAWESPSGASTCLSLTSFAGTNLSGAGGAFYIGSESTGAMQVIPGSLPTCVAVLGLEELGVVGAVERQTGTATREIFFATNGGLAKWDGSPNTNAAMVSDGSFPPPIGAGFVALAERDGRIAALHANGDLVWSDGGAFRTYRRDDGLPTPSAAAGAAEAASLSLLAEHVFVSQPGSGSAWGPLLPSASGVLSAPPLLR